MAWRKTALAAACLALVGASAPAKTAAPAPKPSAATSQKLVANDADVAFALKTVESALRQYGDLPEAKKKRLEAQVAKAAGVKNTAEVSRTMRTMAASVKTKSIMTKENREAARVFLNANPKWCGTVKATRIARQAMRKLGVAGEMSLEDMVNLLPE